VRGGDVVVIAQRRAHTHRDGLLAKGSVNETRDLAIAVELADAHLELSNQRHPPVQLQQRQAQRVRVGGPAGVSISVERVSHLPDGLTDITHKRG
jgi:hypothetical protein